MQNFKAIGATSFESSRDKKLTTHRQKDTETHTDTHTYIFGRRLFFQCRSHINKGNGEIWQLIFDTDSRLYSIKDWESKSIWNFKRFGKIWHYTKNSTFCRPVQVPRSNTLLSISFSTLFFDSPKLELLIRIFYLVWALDPVYGEKISLFHYLGTKNN